MSATMDSYDRRSRVISGVCGEIAARAGVPAWMPRLAFVIFFALHWLLAILLYAVLAKAICAPRVAPVRPARYAPGPGLGEMRARFGRLDERLSDIEAASLEREAALRRAFRDLEK